MLSLSDKNKLNKLIDQLQELSDNRTDDLAVHIDHLEKYINENFILVLINNRLPTPKEKSEDAYDCIPQTLKNINICLKNKKYSNVLISPAKYIKQLKKVYLEIFGCKLKYDYNYRYILNQKWKISIENGSASFYLAIVCCILFIFLQLLFNIILYNNIDRNTFNSILSNLVITFGATFYVDKILKQYISSLLNRMAFGKLYKIFDELDKSKNKNRERQSIK